MKRTVVLLAMALVAGSGYAAIDNWNGGTGSWTNTTYWSNGTVPDSADDARVDTGTANIITDIGTVAQLRLNGSGTTPVVNIGTGANATFGKLFVSWDPSRSGTIYQTAGTVDGNNEMIIGRYGTGIYNLSGGTLTHTGATRDTLIGLGGTGGPGTGYFNLSGTGSFTKTSTDREVLVGASAGSMGTIDLSGSSSFTQNSGAGEVVLGRDAASGSQSAASGTLNISDTATFEAKHTVKVGDAGYGKIDMDGGTFTQTTAGYFFAGDDAGSTGVVNIAGTAQFTSAQTFIVGGYGHGEINQSGGTLTSSGNMYVGNKNGATGEYNLSGGTLDKSGGGAIYVGQEIGAVGAMTVSGGTAGFGVSYIGRKGEGTLTQTGGDIDASHIILGDGNTGSGDYTISGGSLDLTTYLRLWGASDSSTFTVSGSDADHIEVNRFLLGNELMTVELDAGGSTLITADDTGTASELNGTFALDTLVDFSGVANGTTYDIMWAYAGFAYTNNLTFSDLSSTAEFEWSILDNVAVDGTAGTGQILQVTVIPEPATLGMLAFIGGGMLWIRRKFMI